MKMQNTIKDWIIITLGVAGVSLAVFFFLMPSNLAISSISGLAIILATFVPLSVSTITLLFNIVLLIIGYLLIGKEFGVKTIYCAILLPTLLGILEKLFPNQASLTGDAFVDMVCYCFFVSVALAVLFNRNASSGGLDIVAKLMNKYLRMELGKAMSVSGMCIAVAAIFAFDIKTTLLSVIGTYLNGIILDHFIFGSTMKKRVSIISPKSEEIKNYILHDLHSGATIYHAYGAYEDKKYNEIIVIVDKNEYMKLMKYMSETDPDAFIAVYAVNEILYRPKVY